MSNWNISKKYITVLAEIMAVRKLNLSPVQKTDKALEILAIHFPSELLKRCESAEARVKALEDGLWKYTHPVFNEVGEMVCLGCGKTSEEEHLDTCHIINLLKGKSVAIAFPQPSAWLLTKPGKCNQLTQDEARKDRLIKAGWTAQPLYGTPTHNEEKH